MLWRHRNAESQGQCAVGRAAGGEAVHVEGEGVGLNGFEWCSILAITLCRNQK